jgi:hypothetical protein
MASMEQSARQDFDGHSVQELLASRVLAVKIKRDLESQILGLLKNLGLVIGGAKFNLRCTSQAARRSNPSPSM